MSTASAEEEDDPDFVAFETRSFGIGVQGHATRIGGRSEGGAGPIVEAAYGRGRWQYAVEGSWASSSHDEWGGPDPDVDRMRIEGHMWRGAAGVRWLARQFAFDSSGGVELLLQSHVGVQRLVYDGSRLTRPELAIGVAIGGRGYRRPRIGFRLDARVLFTPNDREGTIVACGGRCTSEAAASTGFVTGITFIW